MPLQWIISKLKDRRESLESLLILFIDFHFALVVLEVRDTRGDRGGGTEVGHVGKIESQLFTTYYHTVRYLQWKQQKAK